MTLHRKKSFSIFPSPARMSLTKLSLGGNYDIVEYRNTTIQSEPFIRSKQDGCSDKTEAYRLWRIFSSLYDSPISGPNRLVDLLTLYYGDYYD
jgi:hypothetical protein